MNKLKYLSPILTIISAFILLILAIMDTDFFFFHFWSLMFYADTIFLIGVVLSSLAFLVSLISAIVSAIRKNKNWKIALLCTITDGFMMYYLLLWLIRNIVE